jgi:glucoamylase
MCWHYDRAEDGNVALSGEVDLDAAQGRFLLVLSFGRDESEAGHRARASLLKGFETAQANYVQQWADWQKGLLPLEGGEGRLQDERAFPIATLDVADLRGRGQ